MGLLACCSCQILTMVGKTVQLRSLPIHHHHHHVHVASLGHSVAPCPRLMALRHRSAGEMPESDGCAPASCCVAGLVYVTMSDEVVD